MGNIVISISRLCGCGGSNIARKLATRFGLPLYDRNLLEIISRESGISEDEIAQADEKLLCVAREIKEQGIGADDEFFEYQARILRRLAEDSSYVVLGRCADYVLKDHPNLVRIFITADRRHCIAREADRNGITKTEATALVDKVNSVFDAEISKEEFVDVVEKVEYERAVAASTANASVAPTLSVPSESTGTPAPVDESKVPTLAPPENNATMYP